MLGGFMIKRIIFDIDGTLITGVDFSSYVANTLKKYGIEAYAKPDAPGVYVAERKIGSLGFKIRKGRSYHGLSLNIDCELDGFKSINPCGYAGLEMVRISDLMTDYPNFEQLAQDVIQLLTESNFFKDIRTIQQ